MKNILLLIIIFSCNQSITKNQKLVEALSDSSIIIRGNLIELSGSEFRFDYYDYYEDDSDFEMLQELNYQGGGYSWEGIVYGAVVLSDESLLNEIRFDPEAEGLAVWSNSAETLNKIGRLISVIKSDDKVLFECIDVANSSFKME